MNITSNNDKIIFRIKNPGISALVSYTDLNYDVNENEFKGKFANCYEIRIFRIISGLNKLCNSADIYLGKNLPLCLSFSIETIGSLKIYFSPLEIDNN